MLLASTSKASKKSARLHGQPTGRIVARTTKGDRKCVGDVGRLRWLLEVPKRDDRPLHLNFARMPMPGQRLLDAIGRKLLDAQAMPTSRKQNHAPRVTHKDCGARVTIMRIKLLDGAEVRPVFIEKRFEFCIQLDKPIGERVFGCESNNSARDQCRANRGVGIDDTVAGQPKPWIYAKNAHGGYLPWPPSQSETRWTVWISRQRG